MRRAALVYNPVAGPDGGRAGGDLEGLRSELERHFALTVLETCRERDADACAREALRTAAPDVVVAAGGDGTVSMVASALVGTGVPLGIIARGTANSIAAALRIPADVAGAVTTLLEGEALRIDTARANGRMMLLHASVGFHASAVAHTEREEKNRWGVLAYLKAALAELGGFEPFHVEIETESAVVRCRASNVTVANVAPMKTLLARGPSVVAPDDGALDVTIVAARGLAEAVSVGLHLLRTVALGEAATHPEVGYLSARRLRIDTAPPQSVLVDGEDAGRGRLVVECIPQSLSVLVPRDVRVTPKPAEEKLEGLPELDVEPKRGRTRPAG